MWHVLATASHGIHFDSNAILVFVAVVSLLLTAAGIVGMGFRVGSNAQAIRNYRETAQSWKEKSDAQEGQITGLQVALAEKDHQIAELQSKMALLEKLVLGESTGQQLRSDHAALARRINESHDQLQEIGRGVAALLERIPA